MPADLSALCDDLAAEHADLDGILAPLPAPAWETPTPAKGWAVRDQVTHLAYFDGRARLAATDADGFMAHLAEVAADPAALVEGHLASGRAMEASSLLAWWRDERAALLAALLGLDPALRLPWYGPPMSAASFVTARLMETWCHGQDIADALGVDRAPTVRLRHVAHLGVRARAFNYASHGREVPAGDVHVRLRAPDGSTWTWGDERSASRVEGDALDFCLVVTQRRHVADTALRAVGDEAEDWLPIMQAFAGPPGPGRRPGQFARAR